MSAIPPRPSNRTIISYLMNIKKPRRCDVGNPGPGLKCAHKYGGSCLNNVSHFHIKYILHERKYQLLFIIFSKETRHTQDVSKHL